MKVSREQAAQNREHVLDVAARLFRERGFDGIGVAELMQSAGLTHGGFYGQFASKADLMAQACTRAIEGSLARWRRVIEKAPAQKPDQTSEEPLGVILRGYLSTSHRDRPGEGCVLAALGTEAARQGPELREAITAGTQALITALSALMPGRTKAAKRERALSTFATMVGAVILARAVADPALSKEILDAAAGAVPQARHVG